MLNFVKVAHPQIIRHIPRDLFEQVEGMEPDVIDRIYEFAPLILGQTTLLYTIIDEVNVIKGVLWAEVDIIDAVIFVRLLSVYKEHQGGMLEKATEHLLKQTEKSKIKRLECFMTRPKPAVEAGWTEETQRTHLVYEVNNELIRNDGPNDQDNPERDNTSDPDEPS